MNAGAHDAPTRFASAAADGGKPRMNEALLRTLTLNGLLCAAYVIAGKLGLTLALVHANATAVWPPAGIALAALLMLGRGVWPGIFAGAFLANLLTAGTAATSLAIAAGNTLEALLGAHLVNKYAKGRKAFESPQDIFRFVVLAALCSTMLSATIGVTSLALAGFASWSAYGPIWLTWWLGDAAGDVVVAPLILLWSAGLPRWSREKSLEAVLLLAALLIVSQISFGDWAHGSDKNYPLSFLCTPVLIWAAFRFSRRETATAAFLLSAAALWGTLRGYGPFARESPNESLLLLQGFLGTLTVMTLTLSALVSQRRAAEHQLRGLNKDLEIRAELRSAALKEVNSALRQEIALRRASEEELARSNSELSFFASVASHELQEPLRKLVMFGALLEGGQTSSEAERGQYIGRMQDAAKRMQRLVENILNLSRVTTNAGALETVDLAQVLGALAADYEPRVSPTGGRIDISPLPRIKADPVQIRQVFENLFSNACKFTTKGRPILISVSAHGPENGFIRIDVRDNGIGFEEEYRERIFKPFHRLHRRSDYEGTGIGLALCRRIMMRHGGAITACAKPGEGATFTLSFPAQS